MLETLGSVRRDLGHAFRSLKKDKTFSIVCVVSLGIGMGALVALSVFGRFLTAPGPGVRTDGLAEVLVLPQGPLREKAGEWALEPWSYPDYRALADADTGMSIAAWVMETSEVGIKVPDEANIRHATTFYITPNYFDTFGVTLARGATFDPLDNAPNGEPRVIISHDFWQSKLNSDPDIIGKTVPIEGVPHTVIGLTPDGFQGHFHMVNSISSLVFLPLERHPRFTSNPNIRDDRSTEWIHIHGHLKPGIDMKTADVRVAAVAARLAQENPSTNQYKSATAVPYRSLGAAAFPQSRQILTGMLALAAAVLFVVCLNISGMMMVRGTTRERELSIRSALGAERRRLIQHLFFEALLLAVVAAAIAAFVLFGIPASIAWYLGVPLPPAIDFDLFNVVIASGLCLVVSVLFGLLPALRFSRPSLITAMKDDAGGGGSKTIRVHKIAAMIQVGIAVPFLVISGVMIDRVRTGDLGFETDGLAATKLPPPKGGSEHEKSFSVRRVRDNIQQASGVKSVAVAEGMPVDFDYREFRVGSTARQSYVTAHVTRVGENFLETLGVPIVKGRTIIAADRSATAPVAVISQPLAALLFPDSEPIGEQVTVALDEAKDEQFTVVGVSADFATSQMTTIRPQILVPMPEDSVKAVQLIVRGAAGDEPQLRAALENALKDLGVEPVPGGVFPGIVVGQDLLEKSLGDLISEGMAVGVVGGLVLVLAALGIVGVVGFMVATRTKEIAVRMALGSTRLKIFRLMMGDIVKLVIPGVGGGIVLAAVLIRTIEDVLGTPLTLGHDPLGIMEPLIYAAASAIAISAAIMAGLPAARRATIVQPMVAMRTE